MHVVVALLLSLQAEDLEGLLKELEALKDKPAALLAKIGKLRTDAAADALAKTFDDEKNAETRAQIVAALGDCGTERAVKKLVTIASDDKVTVTLRVSCVDLMGAKASPQALDFLAAVISKKGALNFLRLPAFKALAAFPLAGAEALWRDGLRDEDPEIRARCLTALAPLKDKAVLEIAKKAVEGTAEDSRVRVAGALCWKQVGTLEAAKLLLPAAAGADRPLRAALADALGAVDGDKAADLVYDGLRNASPLVRWVCVRALGRLKHAKALSHAETSLRDREPEVRLAALESIAERKEKKSEEILHREAKKDEGDVAFAAIKALGGYPSDETVKLLGRLLKEGNLDVKVAALEALGEMKKPEHLPYYEQAFKAKDWPVRVTAARQIGKLRTREAIDLLVAQMAREEGRMLGDIGETLRAMTGKALGYTHSHWKGWWDANRETFVFPEKLDPAAAGAAGVTTYYGVPIVSTRIIFCLDISGSMSAEVVAGGKENRLDQAKKELIRVLQSLDKETKFNMIFFDDRLEPFAARMVPLESYLKKAVPFITALQPRGGTNIYDTLELAFTDPTCDTIFLLSDGDPTAGKFVAPDEILREIRRKNRARQVVIHTISLGKSDFMKKIAEDNGGEYVEKK
jgi:HEAT repeat protein